MPRISNIDILDRAPQPVLSIRATTPAGGLPALIQEKYRAMAAYMNEMGVDLSDIPFVAMHSMDMDALDVEMGFPVKEACPGSGEINASLMPGGKYAFCMFLGDYDQLESVYAEMDEWVASKGLAHSGSVYEFYYNGPETPPEYLLTKIMFAVK